jgi:hypothetical protein
VPGCKRQQSDVPRLLDGPRQTTLMRCADAGQTARHNLSALGYKSLQQTNIAIGDRIDLLGAELANFLAAEKLAASAWAAAWPAAGTTRRPAAGTAPWPAARPWTVTRFRLRWCRARLGRTSWSFVRHIVSSLLSSILACLPAFQGG